MAVSKKIIFFDTARTELLTIIVRVIIVVTCYKENDLTFGTWDVQALFKTAAHILALTTEPV